MRKCGRPEEPDHFKNAVSKASQDVSDSIANGTDPKFSPVWSVFKNEFAEAQLGKCGFCEGQVLGLQYGDVEHFQPKAEIHELDPDPDHWGKEIVWQSTVYGRNTIKSKKPGYWWRAYEWDNYLLSCQICNQQWKGNLYPVDGVREETPDAPIRERPLLLSPFDNQDPEKHFKYGRLGEILGLTEKGRATIATCGLDRPSLRLARYKTARVTHERLDEIASSITEREMLRLLRYIQDDGGESQPFCGMVQTIFFQRTQHKWETLGEIISNLEQSPTLERSLCRCQNLI